MKYHSFEILRLKKITVSRYIDEYIFSNFVFKILRLELICKNIGLNIFNILSIYRYLYAAIYKICKFN